MLHRVANVDNGLEVCERWLDFDNFVDDMGVRPDIDRWRLGRKDFRRGFYKANCMWEAPGEFHKRLIPRRGDKAIPVKKEKKEKSKDLLVQEVCDAINSCYKDHEDVLMTQIDAIEKRAESGEEEGLNMVDAYRLLKEAAQATKKAMQAVREL
jgi:hypothetical protein